MRRPKLRTFRNKLDLTDHVQVRHVKKRLRVSDTEFAHAISKAGNSIAAISKEVALQREPQDIAKPPAEVAAVELKGDKNDRDIVGNDGQGEHRGLAGGSCPLS